LSLVRRTVGVPAVMITASQIRIACSPSVRRSPRLRSGSHARQRDAQRRGLGHGPR
jgi:hypothetical protein